jgi:hypothetical protein
MPGHFEEFVSKNSSPGLLLIPARRSIRAVIEGLLIVWLHWPEDALLVWLHWPEDALRNQIRWLPHPEE